MTHSAELVAACHAHGGAREAVWHAIIRRNYGANHFIVGRDHAGPGIDSKGQPFYGPYDAQNLLQQVEREIGVTMVPFKEMIYLSDEDRYEENDQVRDGKRTASISGTAVRVDYLITAKRYPNGSRDRRSPPSCRRRLHPYTHGDFVFGLPG